jgi:hypothetical protein
MAEQADERNERKRGIYVVLAAAALSGVIFSPAGDQGFPVIVLLGPIVTGLLARLLGWSWRLAAAPWVLMGAFMLTFDWVVNNEDVAFHAVLIVTMVGLVALGTLIGRLLRRFFPRSAAVSA